MCKKGRLGVVAVVADNRLRATVSRAACIKYSLGWRTLTKILAHDEPPRYRNSQPRAKPKIDEFLPVMHQILIDDRQVPKKQRPTAKRIFERLRDEHGFQRGNSAVKDAVRAWKQVHQKVCVTPKNCSAR
jgi:uncharacterized protein (UPF0147 family)